MKIGMIGLGSIGKRHVMNLTASGISPKDIIGFDIREDRQKETRDRFGIEKTHGDLESFGKERFDAIYVCSPTSLHLDHMKRLAQQTSAFFVEKPIVHELSEEVFQLEKILEKQKVKTLVGYVFRFSDHVRKLKEVVDSKVIGNILSFRGEFSEYLPDWHPWEDYRSFYMAKKSMGGGSLLDQSHIIDLCHWLFGEFGSIFGLNGKTSSLEVDADDYAEMIVSTKSGATGTIHQDIFGREHKKWIEIKGEKGNIFWDAYDLSVRIYHGDSKKFDKFTFGRDHNKMYLNQLQHFLNVIKGKEKALISFSEALYSMKVIRALERSQAEKRFIDVDAEAVSIS